MKKIMILMLSLAVLFSFAACDNSTPADTEDTPSGTPVTVDATRLAADQLKSLVFDGKINVSEIITKATKDNTVVSGETVVITQNYPQGGNIVGSVTLTLSGTYKEGEAADDPDTLTVLNYELAATDLQVANASSGVGLADVEKVSFDVEGIITGVSYSIKDSVATDTVSTVTVKTPLPTQKASITMRIPVSVNMGAYTYETKEISGADLIEALSTVVEEDDNNSVKYMEEVYGNYWAVINEKDTDLIGVVNSYLSDEDYTNEKASVDVKYNVTKPATQGTNGKYTEEGNVVVTFEGKKYVFEGTSNKVEMTGKVTMTFKATRTADNETALATTSLELGDYTIEGTGVSLSCDKFYPVTLSTTRAITGAENGHDIEASVTFDSTKKTINGFTCTSLGDITGGNISVNGVAIVLDK